MLLLAAVDASVFARVTIAVAGSGGHLLIWRARRLRAQAHTSPAVLPHRCGGLTLLYQCGVNTNGTQA